MNIKGFAIFQLPASDAPKGGLGHSPIVPEFPRTLASEYFMDSRNLGYDYDTLEQVQTKGNVSFCFL